MTSNKLIILGFLFIALGFGFLLLTLTGIAVTLDTEPANLFLSYPRGSSGTYLDALNNAIRLEQAIGLASIVLGVILGIVGCFRKN